MTFVFPVGELKLSTFFDVLSAEGDTVHGMFGQCPQWTRTGNFPAGDGANPTGDQRFLGGVGLGDGSV